jgi:hypothetical protein
MLGSITAARMDRRRPAASLAGAKPSAPDRCSTSASFWERIGGVVPAAGRRDSAAIVNFA